MTGASASDVIQALALPVQSRVDQRVPKKLFLEQGAPTSADKRALQDGIEEVLWIAALKPETIAVPIFRDDTREYLEIAILSVVLRQAAKAVRLIELIHRAIPYPLVLVTEHAGATTVSLAHKRASLGEGGKIVLDGSVLAEPIDTDDERCQAMLSRLAVSQQPSSNLFAVYQGWIDCLLSLSASRLTGAYTLPQTRDDAVARHGALDDHARLKREIVGLRAKAAKETQINRRVEINLAIQRLEAELSSAIKKL